MKNLTFVVLVVVLLALVYWISRFFRKRDNHLTRVGGLGVVRPRDVVRVPSLRTVNHSSGQSLDINAIKADLASRKAQSYDFDASASYVDSRLVVACLGDRAKALRLLDYEFRRSPGIGKVDATLRALDRLATDRG